MIRCLGLQNMVIVVLVNTLVKYLDLKDMEIVVVNTLILEKQCLGTVFTMIFFSLLDLQNASDFDLGKNKFQGGACPWTPLASENFPLF